MLLCSSAAVPRRQHTDGHPCAERVPRCAWRGAASAYGGFAHAAACVAALHTRWLAAGAQQPRRWRRASRPRYTRRTAGCVLGRFSSADGRKRKNTLRDGSKNEPPLFNLLRKGWGIGGALRLAVSHRGGKSSVGPRTSQRLTRARSSPTPHACLHRWRWTGAGGTQARGVRMRNAMLYCFIPAGGLSSRAAS